MKRNKILATLLVVVLCAGTVRVMRTLRPNAEEQLKKRIVERSIGDDKAPVWITEYYDYQCPPCAQARTVLEEAVAAHPEKIYLQVRYFPLPAHKHALKASIAAECASREKGKFWKYHELLFANQKEWAQDPYPSIRFASYADQAGLDMHRFDKCMQDPAVEKIVSEEKKKAEELGIKTTPSFFFNGKLAVGVNGLKEELKALEQ